MEAWVGAVKTGQRGADIGADAPVLQASPYPRSFDELGVFSWGRC